MLPTNSPVDLQEQKTGADFGRVPSDGLQAQHEPYTDEFRVQDACCFRTTCYLESVHKL